MSPGGYIIFLDGDDMLVPDALEKMYTAAKKTDADIVDTEFFYLYREGDTDASGRMNLTPMRCVGRDSVKEPLLLPYDLATRIEDYTRTHFFWSVWNKLYRRDFLMLNDLRYFDIPTGQDMVFSFFCMCLAERYVRLPDITYVYRYRQDSVSRGGDAKSSFTRAFELFSRGIREINSFMEGLDFFAAHPEYRWMAIDFFARYHMNSIRGAYREKSLVEIASLIGEKLRRALGKDAAMAEWLLFALSQTMNRLEDMRA